MSTDVSGAGANKTTSNLRRIRCKVLIAANSSKPSACLQTPLALAPRLTSVRASHFAEVRCLPEHADGLHQHVLDQYVDV